MLLPLPLVLLVLAAADTTPATPSATPTDTTVSASAPPATLASVVLLPAAAVRFAAPVPPAPAPRVAPAAADTGRRRAVEHSDAYYTRLTIHRWASWATVPLFAAQYAAGQQLLDKGDDAPSWAKQAHPALAGGVAALFAVNGVTGGWNFWESRHEPGARRKAHTVLMLLSGAAFTASGVTAPESEDGGGFEDDGRPRDIGDDDGRSANTHRTLAISGMALALAGYALMLPPFRRD